LLAGLPGGPVGRGWRDGCCGSPAQMTETDRSRVMPRPSRTFGAGGGDWRYLPKITFFCRGAACLAEGCSVSRVPPCSAAPRGRNRSGYASGPRRRQPACPRHSLRSRVAIACSRLRLRLATVDLPARPRSAPPESQRREPTMKRTKFSKPGFAVYTVESDSDKAQ